MVVTGLADVTDLGIDGEVDIASGTQRFVEGSLIWLSAGTTAMPPS